MRIGILAHSLTGGGAERQAALWAVVCHEHLGHDVEVLAFHERPTQFYLPATVRVAYAGKRSRLDLVRQVRATRALARRTDLIVAFQPSAALFCLLGGVRKPWLVVSGDDPRYHWHDPESTRIPIPVLRRVFAAASGASAPTPELVDCYRANGVRQRDVWFSVPNIADDAAFGASGADPAERSGALFVGRLVEDKDPLLAIDAAREAGVALTILGVGPMRDRIAAEEARGGVSLAAYTDRPWDVYACHRTLLLTSQFEPFGNVIVESLAAGTPVVAGDCDFGPRYVLRAATYSRVVPRHRAELAEALIATAQRPYGPDEAAECAAIAARFRPEAVAPDISDALERTVAATGRRT